MNTINFSIIIPHYNIPELLEKLLLTTPYDKEDVEVIVVDDRSDKDLEKLLEVKHKFGNMGVKFYRNNRGKKGAGTCRNIGMRHATGKWLLFADADDYFVDDVYEILSRYSDGLMDVVYFKAYSIKMSTGEESLRHKAYNDAVSGYIREGTEEASLKLRYGIINPWCKLIKRSLAEREKIRFDETIVANDVSFSVKIGFYAKDITAADQVIYILTEREGSLTRSYDKEIYKLRNKIFIKRCRFLREKLSKDEWKKLNLTGHERLIAMVEEGYPYRDVAASALFYMLNGIRPIDLKQINIRTMFSTAKEMIGRR
ncbi:MAG: glycosyltransferase family 2 protein [Lachnospiraceae bacterium]|nr:glycosyltransferase family 2 protein [Lachnospiraceae bacterium]